MKYTEGYIRDLNKKPAIEQFLFLDKVAEEFADVIRQIKVGESGLEKMLRKWLIKLDCMKVKN
jgi:hypothetical protein